MYAPAITHERGQIELAGVLHFLVEFSKHAHGVPLERENQHIWGQIYLQRLFKTAQTCER